MKKIIKLFLAFLMILTIAGCQHRKKYPNEGRGTDYDYDFINYIDIITYGQDGLGYIEIYPKELSMDDFNSERDYINAKRDLEAFNFIYIQEGSSSRNISISKTTQLKNGDVVTITPNKKVETSSNMNFEPYDYVVEGLGDSKIINLFSSELVIFYALKDGTYGAYIKNNTLYPQELRDHLKYTIKSSDKPVPGQAVLNVTANLDEEFLKSENCSNITLWLAKHNYRAALSTEKVLNDLIEPIDISTASSSGIETALYKALILAEPDLAKVCNLQQLERHRSAEPYTYTVVYYTSKDGVRDYRRRDVKIIAIDGDYQVLSVGSSQLTKELYALEPYDGANLLLDYMAEKENGMTDDPVEALPETSTEQQTQTGENIEQPAEESNENNTEETNA